MTSVASEYNFERLDRALRALVETCRALRDENASLHEELANRDRHIGRLDDQVLTQNQRRQDALKRIDDLVSRLEWLDAQFERSQKARRSEDATA